jgi:hypothetical protein
VQVGLDLITAPVKSARKTKIVCTLGPSCWGEAGLAALMDAGMNVARFNFSHGDHAGHGEVLQRLRKVHMDLFGLGSHSRNTLLLPCCYMLVLVLGYFASIITSTVLGCIYAFNCLMLVWVLRNGRLWCDQGLTEVAAAAAR